MNYRIEQACQGTYCGKSFSGKINENTRPTPDYKNMIFCVTLDFPIIVFGQQRDRIEVWTNGNDSIELKGNHV